MHCGSLLDQSRRSAAFWAKRKWSNVRHQLRGSRHNRFCGATCLGCSSCCSKDVLVRCSIRSNELQSNLWWKQYIFGDVFFFMGIMQQLWHAENFSSALRTRKSYMRLELHAIYGHSLDLFILRILTGAVSTIVKEYQYRHTIPTVVIKCCAVVDTSINNVFSY